MQPCVQRENMLLWSHTVHRKKFCGSVCVPWALGSIQVFVTCAMAASLPVQTPRGCFIESAWACMRGGKDKRERENDGL